jgi:deoxycytidine triphosphate deaminase
MVPNDPTHIQGAILSDEDILSIANQKKIFIKTPKEEQSRNFHDPNEFDNAIEGHRDPLGCLESAGYLLLPDAYWDGNDFKQIGRSGYELKPNQHAVIRTFQWIKFSDDYCALHFGLHRYQMIGIFVGTGQIQPEWGPAPLYVTIWNSGKANFVIRKDEPLSRLVLLRMTSGNITGRITQERVVRDSIKDDLTEQTTKERKTKLRTLAFEIIGIVLVIAAIFLGSHLLPFLSAPPSINSAYIGAFFAVLGYLVLRILDTLKGSSK